jgi:small redox-active disulfide protein 2
MKIQILGTGCSKCKMLAANTEVAVRELGLHADIEKVTDIREILQFPIMTIPSLLIDGTIRIAGRVPTVDELKTLLA